MNVSVLILAAGLGKRMKSKKPKVLQSLAQKPLIYHVLKTLEKIDVNQIHVIYGHLAEILKKEVENFDLKTAQTINWILQKERLGTGHAVKMALDDIKQDEKILILYGDVPLISDQTLEKLIDKANKNTISMLTADVKSPFGLGRILRNEKDEIIGIVEEKDATDSERNITEINSGIYCIEGEILHQLLPKISNNNAQGEYYLTDIIAMAKNQNIQIRSVKPNNLFEITGVNSRNELANLERIWQKYQAEKLMNEGVSFADPNRIDIRGDVLIGEDSFVDVNVIFEGKVKIGNNCIIGANCILKDVELKDHVIIKPNSMLEDTIVESKAEIGPFARIRPGTKLSQGVKVGNFVELKKAVIDEGSKINHLSYIGDAVVGKEVNIGAGVITCNYDGANKYQTTIEDEVFVGSDSQLIAPVTLEKGAYIASGSTITKKAPQGQLTINRSNRQITLPAWQRPVKKDK